MGQRWWEHAVGYEVYIRSFADGDDDGVGDLWGLRDRLQHLRDLGVDVIWITPCFASPGADHGYDVSDYLTVDELFGGDEALQEVLARAHALGMRVLLDLVPNHTSSEHPWFLDALAHRDGMHRDYYLWRDGQPDGQPPNNWISHFGGPAWTRDDASGQWYLHLFLPEQPDLNWRNPQVRAEFLRILQTWVDRGADGFRVDVAHALTKDPQWRDNPGDEAAIAAAGDPRQRFDLMEHLHDLDQPDNVAIYEEWNAHLAETGTYLLGEVYLLDAARVARYVEPGRLHGAFFFPSIKMTWDAARMRAVLADGLRQGQGRYAWAMSSHDDPRAATRFGGGEIGGERQLAYLTLLAGLPGPLFLYQGDELGLDNGVLDHVAEDPIAARNPGAVSGRDGVRTPMPWAPGRNGGFSSVPPWLPLGSNHTDERTVAAQEDDPASFLHRTRALLRTRREHLATPAADLSWLDGPADVAAYRRGQTVVALNAGSDPVELALGSPARLLFATAPSAQDGASLLIPPDAAVIAALER